MPVYRTKHLSSVVQQPRVPPDGTSLEEQMNAFLATLPMGAVADISTSQIVVGQRVHYLGVVIYQE